MPSLCFQNNLIDSVSSDDDVASDVTERISALSPAHESASIGVDCAGDCRISVSLNARSLLAAALGLKNEVVQATWFRRGDSVQDPTLYTGMLGTAFLCFRSYEITGNKDDLALCLEITDSCTTSSISLKRYVTFVCGRAGAYALGAAAAKCAGDKEKMHYYLELFNEIANEWTLAVGPEDGGFGMPYELFYGRAGFLWACLFVNKYVGDDTIPQASTGPIVDSILTAGRAGASRSSCPLMYQWHGVRYWGAAHGLAGIMHVLMHFPLSKEDAADVKGTLRYMIKNRYYSGNYPSSEGIAKDTLVQWCHGAAGVGMTLCKAAQVFPLDAEFKKAAVEAGEVVWRRGLLRKVGLCHGVSGNTYTFLALHRLTGYGRQLHRANCFAHFLHEHGLNMISSGQMNGGDHPFSLFEGLAGTACLWLDMFKPEFARFPGYEL